MIGTLDFFPPLVDDPRTYGEIAAANALSDVFAMGGRVLFALSIAAFPDDLPRQAMTEILAGADAKVREAGGTLAGGHTIVDAEPKYGLAVIGVAHPDRLLRKGDGRPGDVLVLTKPLGTGLLVAGQRQGRPEAGDAAFGAAVDGMRRLNRAAAEVLRRQRRPRRHRRDRLRPARPRPGDGPRVGHPVRLRWPPPCRPSTVRWRSPEPGSRRAAPATTGASSRPSSDRRSRCPGRDRDPGPRPADLGRAARRGRSRGGLPPSRRGWPPPASRAGASAGSKP